MIKVFGSQVGFIEVDGDTEEVSEKEAYKLQKDIMKEQSIYLWVIWIKA